MVNKILTALVICGFVSGCASLYKPPASGPTATLTVPNYNTFFGVIRGQVRIASKGQDGCGQLARIATDEIGKAEITVKIPADQDQFVSIYYTVGLETCTLALAFSPGQGKDYAMSYNIDRRMCHFEITENGKKAEPQTVNLTRAYASLWDGIKICDSREKL